MGPPQRVHACMQRQFISLGAAPGEAVKRAWPALGACCASSPAVHPPQTTPPHPNAQPHLDRTRLCELGDDAFDPGYIKGREGLKALIRQVAEPKVGDLAGGVCCVHAWGAARGCGLGGVAGPTPLSPPPPTLSRTPPPPPTLPSRAGGAGQASGRRGAGAAGAPGGFGGPLRVPLKRAFKGGG